MLIIQRLVITTLVTIASSGFFMLVGSGLTLYVLGINADKACQMVKSKNVLEWFGDGKK